MAITQKVDPSGYRVGDVELDVVRRRVSRGNRELQLGKLTYELFVALAEAAPSVVTREELIDRVWGGRFVSPATIKQRVILLRDALSDSATNPRYVKVVRGQGYVLVPSVTPFFDEQVRHFGWRRTSLAVGAALLVWVTVAIFIRLDTPRPASSALENQSTVMARFASLSEWVSLIEEVAPQEIRITDVQTMEQHLRLAGTAESNHDVAALMRAIDNEDLGHPSLLEIETVDSLTRFHMLIHKSRPLPP